MKVHRNAMAKMVRTALLVGAGLGVVVAIFQGYGASLLAMVGITLWTAVVLCVLLPPSRWRSIRYAYSWKRQDRGYRLFEFSKRDRTLRRRIHVVNEGSATSETVEDGEPLQQTQDLIPCSAGEFAQHWKQRSPAFMLLMLQMRMCLVTLLCIVLCIVLSVIAYMSITSLRSCCSDLTLGLPFYTAWIVSGLQVLVAGVILFRRPSAREGVAAVILGLVGFAALGVLVVGSTPYDDRVMADGSLWLFVLIGVFLFGFVGVLFAAVPFHHIRGLRHRYYMRLGKRENVYLEFRKRNHRLCRKVRVQYGVPPSREVIDRGEALEGMTDLIPSSAREFTTHWTRRSPATKLLALQLRMAAAVIVSYVPGIHVYAMNNVVTQGIFPDSLDAPIRGAGLLRDLVLGTGLVWDVMIWVLLIGGALLAVLQAVAAIVLQFMKPSVPQRVIALVVALLIPVAVGLVFFVLCIPVV